MRDMLLSKCQEILDNRSRTLGSGVAHRINSQCDVELCLDFSPLSHWMP